MPRRGRLVLHCDVAIRGGNLASSSYKKPIIHPFIKKLIP